MNSETTPQGRSIPVNSPFIDSFSLKIPLDSVQVLDERLTSETAIYYESLDAIDSDLQPPKPIVISWNGITVRFSLAEIPMPDKKTGEKVPTKFVNLTVSAKLLKERYFEGVNSFNISVLYQTFLDFKVFHCSLETFLSGMVSDIDIAINRYCPSPAVFTQILNSLVSQSGVKAKHLRQFGEETNIGLNFNNRRTAVPSLPFIKFYHKELELLHKSTDFKEAFLQGYDEAIKDLTRVEATIRNYRHKTRLDKRQVIPMFRSLEDLLNLSQRQLYSFIVFSLGAYIEKPVRLKSPKLGPTEHIIYELIQNCILKGYDYESLLCVVDTFEGSKKSSEKVAKARMRKQITELYDLLVFKDLKIANKVIQNNHVLEYLKFLGISV